MMYTMGELRAMGERASRTVVAAGVLWAVFGVLAVEAVVSGRRELYDGLVPLWFALVLMVSMLLAVVQWLRWFRAVHGTAQRGGILRDRGWWRVGGWLIPLVNLIVPKRMVNDIWWTPDRGNRSRRPWQVQVWWVLWVAGDAGNLLAWPLDEGGEAVAAAIGFVLLGLSTPFAVWTIRLLTERVRSQTYAPTGAMA